jgi:hypothetical protein
MPAPSTPGANAEQPGWWTGRVGQRVAQVTWLLVAALSLGLSILVFSFVGALGLIVFATGIITGLASRDPRRISQAETRPSPAWRSWSGRASTWRSL